jgi:hypothetical protein
VEEEKPHALEMGEEEAQAAQEKDEKTRRRALTLLYLFMQLFVLLQRSLERRTEIFASGAANHAAGALDTPVAQPAAGEIIPGLHWFLAFRAENNLVGSQAYHQTFSAQRPFRTFP